MLDNWVLSICNQIYRKTLETVHMNLFTLGDSLEAKSSAYSPPTLQHRNPWPCSLLSAPLGIRMLPPVSLGMAEVADASYNISMLCVTPITEHILHIFIL